MRAFSGLRVLICLCELSIYQSSLFLNLGGKRCGKLKQRFGGEQLCQQNRLGMNFWESLSRAPRRPANRRTLGTILTRTSKELPRETAVFLRYLSALGRTDISGGNQKSICICGRIGINEETGRPYVAQFSVCSSMASLSSGTKNQASFMFIKAKLYLRQGDADVCVPTTHALPTSRSVRPATTMTSTRVPFGKSAKQRQPNPPALTLSVEVVS